MTRDRTLPIMPEELRFVELGFQSLENTFKNFMFRFASQARFTARGSIHIHTPMMPQPELINLQRIVVRSVVSAAHCREEVGSWLGSSQIERYIHRDLSSVSFNGFPGTRCHDLAPSLVLGHIYVIAAHFAEAGQYNRK